MKTDPTDVDLFCGAGGTSTGLLLAAERKSQQVRLCAVNHWRIAINTHSLNHPGIKHLCEPVENIHPRSLIRSGRLRRLLASTECTFHSNARGGGPCNEQSRSQPWQLIRWASDIEIDDILMENVREIMNWCPLLTRSIIYQGKRYKKGRPDPRRKGETWRAWLNAWHNLGYSLDYRMQCCADYGDATTRERLMFIARRDRRSIVWPEPTHGPGRPQPWLSARNHVVDWSLKGRSVFGRKKPLCQSTLERIKAGLKKYGGPNAEPFIVMLNGGTPSHIQSCVKSLDDPLPTVLAGGNHAMLCEPFIYHLTHHGPAENRCHSVDSPLPTVTGAHRGEMALCEPVIIQTDNSSRSDPCARSVDQPIPTVVSKQNLLLVQPLIVKYYKTGRCKPVDVPLDTVTTKARFMLVEFEDGSTGRLDILVRMLQPHELASAHSFPSGYKFTGNKEDQTTQIGNSVPVELAAAHAAVLLP